MALKANILVVDDSEGTRNLCAKMLEGDGHRVSTTEDGKYAIELLETESFDLIVSDLMMPGVDGMGLLRHVTDQGLKCPVVLVTAYASVATAVHAMRQGAYDYVPKPFDTDELQIVVRRALEHAQLKSENQDLKRELKAQFKFGNIIGSSRAMRSVYKTVEKAAASSSNVVVYGESGTGKELVARAIHFNSARSAGNFVPLSCSAIPETLLESELFGFRRGAFTGADYDKKGHFEEAHSGTLFLDEIGEISAVTQVKLLRVLQDRRITPIGSTKPIDIDVRFVAATNRDLAQEVQEKQFREDLFYRLHVVPIYLPPLRERKSDIPLLAEHFLGKYAKENDKLLDGFSADVLEQFRAYAWPGNVRELENIVQRAVTFAEGESIGLDDLPTNFQRKVEYEEKFFTGQIQSLSDLIAEVEKFHIERALVETDGQRTETARRLGIDRRTLYDKIKKYRLNDKTVGT